MILIEYVGICEKKTMTTDKGEKVVFEAGPEDRRKIALVDDETAKNLLRFKEFREFKEADAEMAKSVFMRQGYNVVDKKQADLLVEESEIDQAIKDDRKKIERKAKGKR